VPYLAVEVWGWLSYVNHKSHGESLERRYRDLAWSVARRFDPPLTRRDTTFAYYEAMAGFHDSGEFDTNRDLAGIQPPENDTITFNGRQWRQAKLLYLRGVGQTPGTPDYERALEYYRANAIPPGYGWSWGDSNLEQQVFNRLIRDSDDAIRRATRTLGLILANHVASAIDALVTARLDAAARGGRQIKVGSELAPAGGSILWKTTVRFPIGN